MVQTANALNISAAGVVSFDGTSVFSGSPLVNTAILIGSTGNIITNVSPNATIGTPFVSNGVGSNPGYSTTPTVTSITISNAPSVGTDGTNKTYVDAIAAGLEFKNAVYAGTTVALTASYNNGVAGVGAFLLNTGALAAFSVDGTTPPITSRILVKDQASQLQNGIYTLTTVGSGAIAWVLTRATDFDQPSEISPGDLVPVVNGTVNANSIWIETATVTTVGTDSIVFAKFQSAPITTTQFDVLVGGANNTIASVGPGSTGQVLQSAGNASNPAYSTATYPAVATGTGTILRADGTNWLATTSTYPNTNAVSTLLYASASNVMSALATANNGALVTSNTGVPSILAGPGTTGNILQSNAAAAPSFSTATYPAVATGTGTLLRADGTNWVATTSTYPNTNAINTLLYASSANVMSALATANNGVLITGTTGIPSILANGTTGQVLTATTGSPPSWVAAAGGSGSPVIISQQSASNSASIVFTSLGTTYPTYLVTFRKVLPVTNTALFYLTVSTDGGSTYLATLYDWWIAGQRQGLGYFGAGTTAQTQFVLNESASTTALRAQSGDLSFVGFGQSTNYMYYWGRSTYYDANNNLNAAFYGGIKESASSVNAIKFSFSSGNISSGDFTLYGLP